MGFKEYHLLNEKIKTPKVKIVGDYLNGEVFSLEEALEKAKELELDLVLVNQNSNFGICKLMKYEKYLYEKNKKIKNKTLDTKEIKIGPNTAENDLNYRIKHMSEFLKKGHSVKLTMQFKGREMLYLETGKTLLLKMIMAVENEGLPEAMPKLEGKRLFCIVKPKKK